jgi:hypothetical protein
MLPPFKRTHVGSIPTECTNVLVWSCSSSWFCNVGSTPALGTNGNVGCWNTQESVKLPLRHVGSSPTISTTRTRGRMAMLLPLKETNRGSIPFGCTKHIMAKGQNAVQDMGTGMLATTFLASSSLAYMTNG